MLYSKIIHDEDEFLIQIQNMSRTDILFDEF